MPQRPAGLPPEIPPAAPGTQEKPAKKHLFGKKEQKGRKSPKVTKQKKQKSGGLGGSKTSAVGLDMGRTSVCAVRIRHQTGGAALLSVALDNLPPGLIEEGEVKDVDGLAFALKDFWKTHKIKGRKVSLGLANQKVVVRTLEFPMLDEKELRSAIEFQAQDYIPIPLEEAAFDFHILGQVMSEDGIEKQRVLVVAAQKFMVMDFINAIKKAKLVVDSVDLQAFAMLRSLATSSFLEVEGERNEAVAIANIASDVTNIVVTTGGEPQFTRIVAFGGDNFTKAVQDLQGVSFNEAELLKAQAGLSAPGAGQKDEQMGHETGKTAEANEGSTRPWPEDAGIEMSSSESVSIEGEGPEGADTTGQPGGVVPGETGPPKTTPPEAGTEGVVPGETGPVKKPEAEGGWPEAPPDIDSPEEIMTGIMRAMEISADALAEEIRRSLDYYMSQEQSVPISKLVLSGGGAMLNNLDLHLAQVFPFPVEIGNPLTRVTQNRSDLSDDELRTLAPRLAIAIGLALEDEV